MKYCRRGSIVEEEDLVLFLFQGPHACTRIKKGKAFHEDIDNLYGTFQIFLKEKKKLYQKKES